MHKEHNVRRTAGQTHSFLILSRRFSRSQQQAATQSNQTLTLDFPATGSANTIITTTMDDVSALTRSYCCCSQSGIGRRTSEHWRALVLRLFDAWYCGYGVPRVLSNGKNAPSFADWQCPTMLQTISAAIQSTIVAPVRWWQSAVSPLWCMPHQYDWPFFSLELSS